MQALLEMDAIPAGMELFPAANEDAWKLIQRIIEESDYYVLIIGGRYGTTDTHGIGYTEREYDFAMSCGIPVIPFLHEKPDSIPVGKSEIGEEARNKLSAFRQKVEKSHHCKYWNDPEQLGSRVTRGLLSQTKTTPRTGWVRADEAGGADAMKEINRLRNVVESLTASLTKARTEPPKEADSLQGGNDIIPLKATVEAYTEAALTKVEAGRYETRSKFEIPLAITWNEAFSACGPLMLQQEAVEHYLQSAIENRALEIITEKSPSFKKQLANNLELSQSAFQTIKVQLIALGLITKSEMKRTASDRGNYWTLTPYGEITLMRISALRR